MDDIKFEINDYYELLNLHKALLEARFHEGIDNRYLAGSPIVADIHKRIINNMISMEMNRKGKEEWSDWIKICNRKDIRLRVEKNIIKLETWEDNTDKYKLVKQYISPFVATDNEIEDIIKKIDSIKNNSLI